MLGIPSLGNNKNVFFFVLFSGLGFLFLGLGFMILWFQACSSVFKRFQACSSVLLFTSSFAGCNLSTCFIALWFSSTSLHSAELGVCCSVVECLTSHSWIMETGDKRNKTGAFGPSPEQRRMKAASSAVAVTDLALVESSNGDDEDDDLQMVGTHQTNNVAPPWFRAFEKRSERRINKQFMNLNKQLDEVKVVAKQAKYEAKMAMQTARKI